MQHPKRLWFRAAIVFGCLVGVLLLVQSIVGYFYVSRRLQHDQLFRDADRHAVSLERSSRQRGASDAAAVGQLLKEVLEEEQQRLAWLRILDATGRILVEAGKPTAAPASADELRHLLFDRARVGHVQNTERGSVFVVAVPLRLPMRAPEPEAAQPRRRPNPLLLEIALYEESAARGLSPLRINLLISSAAALMLLGSMALLALRLRAYLRGQQSEQQLAIARRVQHNLLPALAASYGDLECAGICIPAWQVGGDFYDVFAVGNGAVALVVGDVAGKGLGAALVMSLLHGAIRCSNWVGSPEHETATQKINALLYTSTAPETFATLFWAYYAAPMLYYVNAGHCPPLLLRKGSNGNVRVGKLEEGGPVVGVLPMAEYRQGAVTVESGDVLVLYSDGVLEAEDAAGEQFGEERLWGLIHDRSQMPCTEICTDIVTDVRRFSNDVSLQDDLTVLLVHVR